ncbi:MAG: dihydrofolate reductase [Fuerstiella sp.]
MLGFNPSEVIVIGAMSETRAIGQGDGMPWDVPEEYQHFVDAVENQCVIIGRRSFDIFGADFEAHTFVISRNAKIDNVTVCASLDEAIGLARRHKKTIFIAGGKSIYELAIPVADRMLLSTIKGHHEGDVLFPKFNERQWRIDSEQDFDRYVLRDYRKA